MRLSKLAKSILKENIYCTLATADEDGIPWAATVYYCMDNKYNLYYISQIDSTHTKNILRTGIVAFSIFDSHQTEGTGNGIQGIGRAFQLKDDIVRLGLKWYKSSFIELKPLTLTGEHPYRMFKIIPEHLYVLDPKAEVDKRVAVYFK